MTFIHLHFSGKHERSSAYLRDGDADLEIGVVQEMGPEVRVRALFRDRYVGVVRGGHPLSADGGVTAERYAAFPHVVTPHGGRIAQSLDAGLSGQGLRRSLTAVVPTFPAALAVACGSDMVALLPASLMVGYQRPGAIAAPASAHVFELPVPVDGFSISLMWHPRAEADPAHRWLRELIGAVCRERMPL